MVYQSAEKDKPENPRSHLYVSFPQRTSQRQAAWPEREFGKNLNFHLDVAAPIRHTVKYKGSSLHGTFHVYLAVSTIPVIRLCDEIARLCCYLLTAGSLFFSLARIVKEVGFMEFLMWSLILAAGMALLAKGADWFVGGASELAAKLGIPPLIVGLTVVAMGTSLPEAAVSISAVLKGNADITVGNVLGSNILNILIILGLSAVITPLTVERCTIRYELPFLMAISILLLLQGLDGVVGLGDGMILLLLFGAYLTYLFASARKKKTPMGQEPSATGKKRGWQILLSCAFGLAMTVAGSSLAVDAACAIAGKMGMSERFIGLTIVALGTSLPELVTSVTAARKGNPDIAMGNIVGSNLFNILFVVGISALLRPVAFAEGFRLDSAVSAAAALLLILFCRKDKKLKRWHGAAMLAGYALYFAAMC